MNENDKKTFKELWENIEEIRRLSKLLRREFFESNELMKAFINATRNLSIREEIIGDKRYVYLLKNRCFAIDNLNNFIKSIKGKSEEILDLASDITNVFDSLIKNPSTKIICECEKRDRACMRIIKKHLKSF